MTEARKRTALVCGGGGITGGMYEIGVLRALCDLLGDDGANNFDMYVGVSAGSLVASLMAAGISSSELYEAVIGRESRYHPFSRSDIFSPNVREYIRRLKGAPRVITEGLFAVAAGSAPTRDLIANLSGLTPSGLFSNKPMEDYVRGLFEAVGAPTRFEDMRRELYLTAVNVDTGYRVVFGERGTKNVDIPRAVRASSTIPFLFTPTRIDGGDFIDGGFDQNLPIDVAIRHGAELVVAINPLVPVVNAPRTMSGNIMGKEGTYLKDRGGTFILEQAFRFLLSSRLRYSLQQLKAQHPEVDILLFEPRPDDLKMFSYNIMRYSARHSLLRHGYNSALATLRSEEAHYTKIFNDAGIDTNELPPAANEGHFASFEPNMLDDLVGIVTRLPGLRRFANERGSPTQLLE